CNLCVPLWLFFRTFRNYRHTEIAQRRSPKSTCIGRKLLTQRRKALPRFKGFLCVFAPLGQKYSTSRSTNGGTVPQFLPCLTERYKKGTFRSTSLRTAFLLGFLRKRE